MTERVEVELKLALAEPARLPALLAALPAPEGAVLQRNVYLEDPGGVLVTQRVMTRLREERDEPREEAPIARAILTCKRRTSIAHGVFSAEEVEQAVPVARWLAFRDGGEPLLDGLEGDAATMLRDTLGVTALTVRGATTNLRRRVRAGGFLLEVDETRFPDGSVDAEVEVETDDPEGARAVVEAAAAEAGVALAVQTLGKYARFLKRS